MSKVLVEKVSLATECRHPLCRTSIEPGGLVYPARLRDDVYCSPKCRNKHSRILVQYRRRQVPEKKDRDNVRRRLRKYDLSLDDFIQLWEQQSGRCACCGVGFPDKSSCHIDHHHSSGIVRGLLCGTCNVGLGMFKDDPRVLQRAIMYLTGDTESAPSVVDREEVTGR